MTRKYKQILRRVNRILHTPLKQLNPFIVILAFLLVGLVIFLTIKVSFIRYLLVAIFLGTAVVTIFITHYRLLRFFWRCIPHKIFIKRIHIPRKKIFITAGLTVLIGVIIFFAILIWNWYNQTNTRLTQLETRYGNDDKLKCNPTKLPRQLQPSIVRIIGNQMEGTGFAITSNEIITNFHVIEDEPSPKIVFSDNSFTAPIDIVGDKPSDLAILKVKEPLTPLTLLTKPDDQMIFGEPVYSVGYPKGSIIPGPPLLSPGWFNGYRTLRDEMGGRTEVAQTNTSLVPGMSGGPMVDACGDVIAINTMSDPGLAMYIEIGFAIYKRDSFTRNDVTYLKVNPLTPEGAVKTFYDLINAARWQEAYNLIAPSRRQLTTFKDWQTGYTDTLHVDVIKSEYKNGKVLVKLFSRDWIDGLINEKFFEGEWEVVFAGDVWNLSSSNIKEIPEPEGYRWWYE